MVVMLILVMNIETVMARAMVMVRDHGLGQARLPLRQGHKVAFPKKKKEMPPGHFGG